MHPMSIIEPKHSAVVPIKQVGQQECEVVANNLLVLVDPDFFPENAYTPGAPKSSFVVGVFARAVLAAHEEQLNTGDASIATPERSLSINNNGPASAGPLFVA
jgi:hypothetical protein